MSDNLFKHFEQSGLYFLPTSRQAEVTATADKLRFTTLSADIGDHATIADALTALGTRLSFPIWYGANFDALMDCLTDPDWLPAKGHVLLISGIARLRSADPTAFVTLIEVFKSAAEARRAEQHPFWILIDAPARGIPHLPDA